MVVWTCNHCPYALAWHDRLIDVARDYAEPRRALPRRQLQRRRALPADSLEAMSERVEAEELAVPYLHDESQEAARAWGAEATPDVFVLDADLRLRYRGAPDADYNDPSQNAAWLRERSTPCSPAASAEPAETKPVGCSIKWK